MKRRLFLTCVAVLALAGCGGSDNDGGGGSLDDRYVGRWVGSWQSSGPLGGQNGTSDITISADGHMLGTIHNNSLAATGDIQGTVGSTGQASGNYAYPLYKGTFSGSFTLQQNGHLGGAIDTFDTNGNNAGTVTFDLTKQ